jgi:hypothetical protein
MPEGDRMKATIPFEDLACAFVCFRHDPFKPLGLLLGVDDAHSQPGVVHDGQNRVVSDLGLLVFGHLAVVAGRFGSFAASGERMTHCLCQGLERDPVLVMLDRCGRMAKHVTRHVDGSAGPINQFDSVQDEPNQPVDDGFAHVATIPLEQIPLRAEMLSLRMEWVVAHDGDFAVVGCFEESGYLLKVDPCCADVILQP